MSAQRWRHVLAGLLLVALAGCGGGGGSGSTGGGGSGVANPPAPTPTVAELPPAVSIAGPSQAETGASTLWQSSLGTVQPGWAVLWSFGDDTVSTEAEPSHAFRRAGDYTVRLTVSKGSLDSRTATASVRVRATAMSADRSCSGPGYTAWCWQQPLPFARDLLDAVLVDRQTAFAVGPGNAIVTTRNGGVDWPQQDMPAAPAPAASATVAASQALQFVRFADASVGVASASFPAGRVLRTVDGGRSWTATTAVDMYWIKGLWLLDRQTIVVSGFRQSNRFGYGLNFADLTLISSDGGQTWREAALVVSAVTGNRVLWGVPWAGLEAGVSFMVSRDLGLTAEQVGPCCVNSLVSQARPDLAEDTDQLALSLATQPPAQPPYQQRVHRSTDEGRTWATVTVQSPAGLLDQRLVGIGYLSATEAWATFVRPVLNAQGVAQDQWQRARSSDGGITWSASGAPIEGAAYSSARLLRLDARAWALAGNTSDALWFEDGDATLRTLRLPESAAALQRMQRKDGSWLAGFGAPERWYFSSDLGATWRPTPGARPGAPTASINALWFFDTQRGLAADTTGGLQSTTDGGRSWTVQSSSFRRAWTSLQFTADGAGWGLAADGLWRTPDRGLNWFPVNPPEGRLQRFHAVDTRRAWLITLNCAEPNNSSSCQSRLYGSSDAGTSWVRLALPDTAQHVHFSSAERGVASGSGGLWFSLDGGRSWSQAQGTPPPLGLVRVRFVDTEHGWILYAGSAGPRGQMVSMLLRTRDGGQTWTATGGLPTGAGLLSDMSFGDRSNGWVVGAGGLVVATRDGGDSWEIQNSGTPRALLSLAAVDGFTAWVGGEKGTLLATSTGGR